MACTRDSGDSSTGAVTVRLRHGDYHHHRNLCLLPPTSTGVRTSHYRDGRACWRREGGGELEKCSVLPQRYRWFPSTPICRAIFLSFL